MDVKVFEAFSMKDALRAVKSEFGHDAVILNTRRRPGAEKGKTIVEITAAPPASARQLAGAATGDGVTEGIDDLTRVTLRLERKLGEIEERMVSRDNLAGFEAGLTEVKNIIMEVLRSQEGSVYGDLPESMENILRPLRINGLAENHIGNLVNHLKDLPDASLETARKEGKSLEEFYKAHAIRWMLKSIRISPAWELLNDVPNIHVLCGSSGAGKSTMVAKLAANYSRNEGKKVVVVSLDTARIAAAEQMRTMARVINVPFAEMQEVSELPEIIARYQDARLIIIDTAGRNPKNSDSITGLQALKNHGLPVDFHLVLSTTEKESQSDRIIRRFSPLGINSLIFTRLDETWSYGDIFNLSTKWGISLGYFGIGQRIPEDVERASRERVVERIFGI